jgi:hypothetical protein
MSSTGTFDARIDELRKMVGSGKITAGLTVDQRYAHRQHEELSYHHPRGGQAKYLEAPLMDHFRDYIEDYARTVLDDGGQAAMRRSAENLSDQVEMHAPREFLDLMFSGAPSVTQDGRTIYSRPPKRRRLTDAELRDKSRALLRARWNAGLPVFWTKGRGVGRKVIHVPAGKARKPW